MDINCTHLCMHQREGKCHLTDLTTAVVPAAEGCADCPYYKYVNTL